MSSFEDFYREAKDPCYRAVLAAIGDSERATEALAEAMVRACARWDRLSGHPNPEAWLVLTAVNAHRSWLRRWKRGLTFRSDAREPSDPEQRFDPVLLEALRGLSRRQREVVALRVLLDLSTQAVAEELGIAPGTVTAHLHRALGNLRRVLGSTEVFKEDEHELR